MGLVYIHPPKCAGTSVVRALRLRYLWKGMGLVAHRMRPLLDRSDPPLEYVEYEYQANRAADAVAAFHLTNGKRMVAGHFWYGHYLRLLDDSVCRMTVLRDPVKRFLSHYRYLVWKIGLKQDFEEFLASQRAQELGSIYGFYFANRYPSVDHDEESIIAESIDTLKNFTLVGDVSDIQGFLQNAKQHIGGPLLSLKSNRTPKTVKPGVTTECGITEENRERIAYLTSVDRHIYSAVVQMPNFGGKSTSWEDPLERSPSEVIESYSNQA